MGAVILTKPISLYGLYSYNKPKVHLSFVLNSGASDFKLQDLDLNGDKGATNTVIQFNNASVADVAYGDILISGCDIHDYGRALASGNVSKNKINSLVVDNCIVTNILTSGGEFINFRLTYVAKISLTNSTFNNCSASEFIRADAGSGNSGTGLNTDILINACTISNKSMTATGRILYVRFLTNSSTVTNTLFAETLAIYSNQSATTAPTFSNNNYYSSPNLFTENGTIKIDASGTFSTLDPQFVDAPNGNFKVQNQALIDKKVGDPRWFN
jgi:hypothetical protein